MRLGVEVVGMMGCGIILGKVEIYNKYPWIGGVEGVCVRDGWQQRSWFKLNYVQTGGLCPLVAKHL